MPSELVSFPGARWWKFDCHTHTPASKDTIAWQRATGTAEEITPLAWLLKFMEAGLDCVAVTDHNSGGWLDALKAQYAELQKEAVGGNPRSGFRQLCLFPGVELSVQGGVHLLAIFSATATGGDVDRLLGSVGYRGTPGDSDGVTSKSLEEVIRLVLDAGALPIPAHADKPKGMLACVASSRALQNDAHSVRQALENEGLLAMEWCDGTKPLPTCVDGRASQLARVLGSDCHNFRDATAPGTNFTWVKMAKPTLEGLRLALLDGNGVAVRRSDEAPGFSPMALPAHYIAAIEIHDARLIGNGDPARLALSPFFNAIVGGRGTGKSTVVHALRLASGRSDELSGDDDPGRQFHAFTRVAKGRADSGALRDKTTIRLEWRNESGLLRLSWRAGGGTGPVDELRDGEWVPSASQAVNPARFPLRIFSQGQVAAIAGGGRGVLLDIIDEAAAVEPTKAALEDARRLYKEHCARLRTLDGKLAELPEVERKLAELVRKLEAFSGADQAALLIEYARAQGQIRDVKATLDQARQLASHIDDLAERAALDDWPAQHFDDDYLDIAGWRAHVNAEVEALRAALRQQADQLRHTIDGWNQDSRLKTWHTRAEAAKQSYDSLQQALKRQGVQEAGAFSRLTQERQVLEQRQKELQRLKEDRVALLAAIEAQRSSVAKQRRAITAARQAFVKAVLDDNPHVRITVEPYGYEPRHIEREVRRLLDLDDERFADDILGGDEQHQGLAAELAQAGAADKETVIAHVQERIAAVKGVGGHFRRYLERRFARPEAIDEVRVWYPEDDLRIEYWRSGQWAPIEQGSQGQRSAALLAFLLAFGTEPIVLDQPEDDLDNHLIYDLIVQQIRENKQRRQLIIVTHNANVVVNGDAELIHVMEYGSGQCFVKMSGALQEDSVRQEVCRVMEGGHEAFTRRWKRLGREGADARHTK